MSQCWQSSTKPFYKSLNSLKNCHFLTLNDIKTKLTSYNTKFYGNLRFRLNLTKGCLVKSIIRKINSLTQFLHWLSSSIDLMIMWLLEIKAVVAPVVVSTQLLQLLDAVRTVVLQRPVDESTLVVKTSACMERQGRSVVQGPDRLILAGNLNHHSSEISYRLDETFSS